VKCGVESIECEVWSGKYRVWSVNNFDQEVPEGSNMDSCGVVQKVQGHASTFWDD